MKTKLFITGLLFFAFTAMGMAQDNQNPGRQADGQGKGYAFVDENKDGVCDNLGKGTPGMRGNGKGFCNGQGMMQGPGKGQGQGQGRGRGQGRNFIDADNDGVCDRFKEPSKDVPQKK